MKNSTRIKVPKKFVTAIKELYQDDDGFWGTLNDGWAWGCDSGKVFNGEDEEQLLQALDEIHKA